MQQSEQTKDPFEIMENSLLPVFKEATVVAKEIAHNPNYFKDNYKASRLLYAMAIVSLAINSLNANNKSDEQTKKNIERIDLFGERYFYNASGSLGKKENIFNRPEIENFKLQMRELNAQYFNDTIVQDCLGCVEADAAVGIWSENQPLISPDGKILDWKKAPKSNIFKFAVGNIENNMFSRKMKEQSKENKWNKKEWNKNYPIVKRECEKTLELEISKICLKKHDQSAVSLSMSRESRG